MKTIHFKAICIFIYVCSCGISHEKAMKSSKDEFDLTIESLMDPLNENLNFEDIENQYQLQTNDDLKLEENIANKTIANLNQDFENALLEDQKTLEQTIEIHDTDIQHQIKKKDKFSTLSFAVLELQFKKDHNIDALYNGMFGVNQKTDMLKNHLLETIQQKEKGVINHHSKRKDKIISHKKEVRLEIMEHNSKKTEIINSNYTKLIQMKKEKIEHEKVKLDYNFQQIKNKIKINEDYATSKEKIRIAKNDADTQDIINQQKQNKAKSDATTAQELNQMIIREQFTINMQKKIEKLQDNIVKNLESIKEIKETKVTCKSILRGTGKIYINLRMICYCSQSNFRVEVYFMDSYRNEVYNWITPVDLALVNLEDITKDWTIYIEKSLIHKISDVGIRYAWPKNR